MRDELIRYLGRGPMKDPSGRGRAALVGLKAFMRENGLKMVGKPTGRMVEAAEEAFVYVEVEDANAWSETVADALDRAFDAASLTPWEGGK